MSQLFWFLNKSQKALRLDPKQQSIKPRCAQDLVLLFVPPREALLSWTSKQKHPPALHAQHHVKIISILSVEATHHSCILISAIQNSQEHHPAKQGKLNNTTLGYYLTKFLTDNAVKHLPGSIPVLQLPTCALDYCSGPVHTLREEESLPHFLDTLKSEPEDRENRKKVLKKSGWNLGSR